MSEPKEDLWSQFAEDQPGAPGSLEKKSPKKPAATDGSEWTGKFDRRSKPRVDADGQTGLVSEELRNGAGDQASNEDHFSDGKQQPE